MKGQVSKQFFVFLLAFTIVYCFCEIDLYQSILGPLNKFSGVDYMSYHRIENFNSGKEIEQFANNNIFNGLKPQNMYITDYSPRWSTLNFSFQYADQIIVEYQLTRMECNDIQKKIEQEGFRLYINTPNKFGDFLIYYFNKSDDLQYILAINPKDHRLLLTCSYYRFVNSKSFNHSLFAFLGVKERFYTPSSIEYNLRSLEYASGIFYSEKPKGIWVTQ